MVRLEGDFDISERDRVRDVFAIVMGAGLIAVDLTAVGYLDSWTLQNIVALAQITSNDGGRFVMFGLSPTVRRILDICFLPSSFDIRAQRSDVADMLKDAQVRTLTIVAHHN